MQCLSEMQVALQFWMILWNHLQDDSVIQCSIYSGVLTPEGYIQTVVTLQLFPLHWVCFGSRPCQWDTQTPQLNFKSVWSLFSGMRFQRWQIFLLMICPLKDLQPFILMSMVIQKL